MSRFVLQPCKIREDRVVLSGAPDLRLDMRELVARFAPSRTRGELQKLRAIRSGGYLGRSTSARTGREQLFFIWRDDRRNGLQFLLKQDPAFPSRVQEICRVVSVDWGSRVEEVESGKEDKLPPLPPRRRSLREGARA